MNVRLTLVLFLFFFYSLSFSQEQSISIIEGTIKNFQGELSFMKLGEENELKINSDKVIIQPDSTGYISLAIPIDSPGYYRFARNTLYLSPGDSLSFSWDAETEKNITFKGSSAAANNYLKNIVAGGPGSYLKGPTGVQSTIDKTIDYILDESRRDEERLDKLTNVSERFKNLEKGRINADRWSSLNLTIGMFQVANKLSDEEYDVLDEQYSPRIKKLMDESSEDFLNSDYLVFDAYRMMLYSLTSKNEEQTIPIRIDEWIKSKVIFNNLKKANERTVIEGFKPQIDEIKTPEYQDLLVAAYQFYLAFNSGDEAISFTAHDREGNAVNLVDYKGKVIYLEFWATWCMPCIEQFAPLDALQEEFKDNEDIVILAVSIDKNIRAWEKHLDKRQPKTAQVLVNSDELDDYAVTFIPRTIIINKEFKVVDMHAKAPSDPATKSYLMELMKK